MTTRAVCSRLVKTYDFKRFYLKYWSARKKLSHRLVCKTCLFTVWDSVIRSVPSYPRCPSGWKKPVLHPGRSKILSLLAQPNADTPAYKTCHTLRASSLSCSPFKNIIVVTGLILHTNIQKQ